MYSVGSETGMDSALDGLKGSISQQEIPQIFEASKLSHQECTHYAVVPSGFSPHIVFSGGTATLYPFHPL